MPVPVSPIVGAGLQRPAVALAGDAHRPAAGLRDHVEREVVLERPAFAEALHLRVDDARVDRAHHVGAEPQPLDRAGGEVLDEHVGLAGEFLDQIEAALVLQVDGDGFLVGVELQEIMRVLPWRRIDRPARDRRSSGFRPSRPRRRARPAPRCRTARPRIGSDQGPGRRQGSRHHSSDFFSHALAPAYVLERGGVESRGI